MFAQEKHRFYYATPLSRLYLVRPILLLYSSVPIVSSETDFTTLLLCPDRIQLDRFYYATPLSRSYPVKPVLLRYSSVPIVSSETDFTISHLCPDCIISQERRIFYFVTPRLQIFHEGVISIADRSNGHVQGFTNCENTTLQSSVELLWVAIGQFEYAEKKLLFTLKGIGFIPQAGEAIDIAIVRQYVCLLLDVIPALKGSFIAAVTLATFIGFVMIFHMLSSYRTNMLKLYRGDNSDIPPKSQMSNSQMLAGIFDNISYQHTTNIHGKVSVSAAKWTGYQIAFRLALFHFEGIFTYRRLLFLVTYFMFFYNIFMGFLSCFMRIIKSTIIGTSLLSRLDQSILPKKFQKFDPERYKTNRFNAYIGFMHVEVAHTHPVVIVFLRLMVLDVGTRKGIEMVLAKELKANGVKTTVAKNRSFMLARNKWQTMYTLLNNPSLKQYRQHHITPNAILDSKRKMSTVNHNTVSFRMLQMKSTHDNVAFEMAKADEYIRF
ncbi:hypothetical protein CHS0354_004566 [Potamilus streckersoni]|uniref:Uncharacterized protein n=1 Tax=Potamilus streckersoni TaxID=2493646 RepID=A0AAE0VPY0_9BIVA|nr:hypothetical protein CHS0354_004566 [Potamilus streckersoni]